MFFDNLQRICTEKGTTPTAVLKDIHKSTSKVTAWKNGSTPNGEILVLLANHLDCSVDYLLGRDKYVNPQPQEQPTEIKKASVQDERLNKFFLLTPDDQEEILDFIDVKLSRYQQDSAEMA